MQNTSKPFYRPELDAVRFFAFLSVFCHHVLVRNRTVVAAPRAAAVDAMAFGLCLFFCLSAYLITLILLREKATTGTVHLRRFYFRRVLRIWPLYFVGLACAFAFEVGMHHVHATITWFLAACFMAGNLVPRSVIAGGHLWSISVEEQFYLFWPIVMCRVNRVGMLLVACLLVLLSGLTLVHYGRVHRIVYPGAWNSSFLQFGMCAVGILLALFENRRRKFSPSVSVLLILIACGIWCAAAFGLSLRTYPETIHGPGILCAGYALVAIGCALILIAAPGVPRWPRWIIYLGQISYGLYVFHIPVIYLVGYSLRLSRHRTILLAFFVNILVAALSYKYFESPFLRLKRKFEIIPTRPV
jgi:peptidoglycan/LPS O-acetylase OafA/YrhL